MTGKQLQLLGVFMLAAAIVWGIAPSGSVWHKAMLGAAGVVVWAVGAIRTGLSARR